MNEVPQGFTLAKDLRADRIITDILPRVTAAVAALDLPKFAGLCLGGGYARGEGGVFEKAGGGVSLYNDLDFFILTDEASPAEQAVMLRRLEPLSQTFGAELGIDVDFCVRNGSRVRLDRHRVMIQELLRGHVALLPKDFNLASFARIETYPASDLPKTEAQRLLLNRGMGLVFAAEKIAAGPIPDDFGFVLRNLNKAVLGAGDARLIASGRYAWRIAERAALLNEPAYTAAVAFKARPSDTVPPCWDSAWCTARDLWCAAAGEIGFETPRSGYETLRWFVRRRTIGVIRTIGREPVARILYGLFPVLSGLKVPADVRESNIQRRLDGLKGDWQVFN